MRWEQGRAEIERLLGSRELQRVPASRAQADRLIGQAHRHVESAARLREGDPEAAYAVLYDAARKALTALLENEGLRPTSNGGHVAVLKAVSAQLIPPMTVTLRPFDRMRRRRRDAEYPSLNAPALTSDDVAEDLPKVREIIALAERMLDEMSPF